MDRYHYDHYDEALETELEFYKMKTENTTEHAINQCNNNYSSRYPILIDDNVYAEAHDLVKNWMTSKKLYGDHNDRESYMRLSNEELEDIRSKIPSKIEIHRDWEHLLDHIKSEEDFKHDIDEFIDDNPRNIKEDKKLNKVMENLRKKTFVDKKYLKNIDSPQIIDPDLKMKTRQEEVRKRKEERMKWEEARKLEKLAEKEARYEAFKREKEVKKLKEMTMKKEEELIQHEMKRIRTEMLKQKENEFGDLKKKEELASIYYRRKILRSCFYQWLIFIAENKKKAKENKTKIENEQKIKESKIFIEKQRELEALIEKKNEEEADFFRRRRLLKNCLIQWSIFVIETKEKRIKESARFREQIVHVEMTTLKAEMQKQRELEIENEERKMSMASSYHRRKILKKCLITWSLFVIDEKESRWFYKLEEMRKKKMSSYLTALQEKLVENENKIEILSKSNQNINIPNDCELNEVPVDIIGTPSSEVKEITKSSNIKPPKYAWQVTKKHVNLPIESMVQHSEKSVHKIPIKSLKEPKPKDIYSRRNLAQKEIIEKQKEKIREQQRIIDNVKCEELLIKLKSELHSENKELPYLNNNEEIIQINDEDLLELSDNNEELELSNQNQSNIRKNKFVIQMEERAKEREKLKLERMERKRIAEEERKKQLAEQLAEQSRLEAEEKVIRDKLLKEKREQERKKEEIRKKKLQIEQQKNDKADELYRKTLLNKYGIKQWKKILIMKIDFMVKAQKHYHTVLIKKVFKPWLLLFQSEQSVINKRIDHFYSKNLLAKYFYQLKMYKHRTVLLMSQAQNHYIQTIQLRCFKSWRLWNHREQMRLERLEVNAELHYNTQLIRKSWSIWKELPVASRIERERERRILAMKEKVANILPDFQLNSDMK